MFINHHNGVFMYEHVHMLEICDMFSKVLQGFAVMKAALLFVNKNSTTECMISMNAICDHFDLV